MSTPPSLIESHNLLVLGDAVFGLSSCYQLANDREKRCPACTCLLQWQPMSRPLSSPYSLANVLDTRYSTQLLSLSRTRPPSAQLRTAGAYDDKIGLPADVFKLLLDGLASPRACCCDSIKVVSNGNCSELEYQFVIWVQHSLCSRVAVVLLRGRIGTERALSIRTVHHRD
jgi:hypothetical protein